MAAIGFRGRCEIPLSFEKGPTAGEAGYPSALAAGASFPARSGSGLLSRQVYLSSISLSDTQKHL